MVTLIVDDISIVSNAIIYLPFSNQALDDRDIDFTFQLAPASTKTSNLVFLRYPEIR